MDTIAAIESDIRTGYTTLGTPDGRLQAMFDYAQRHPQVRPADLVEVFRRLNAIVVPDDDDGAERAAQMLIDPPGSYNADAAALELGEGRLFMVRVINSHDESDYAELEVRAPSMAEAADKAEAHARRFPDMYFDIDILPTFSADRNNIERLYDNRDPVVAPHEVAEQQADGTWAIKQGGAFIKGGFERAYQAEVAIANRAREFEEAHGIVGDDIVIDDGEDQFAGSDARWPGVEA